MLNMKNFFGKQRQKDSSIINTIKKAYAEGEEDESLEPIVVFNSIGHPLGRLNKGDSVIFYDIRGEREVELTESLTVEGFNHFSVKKKSNLNFVSMIEYNDSLPVKVAFPCNRKIKNTLSEVISRAGLRLCKIAESEKAVHVCYFMNGKSNEIFPGEDRIIVPSPAGISSYTFKPEMSASKVSKEISLKLKDDSYSLIVANFANVDVVGHSEDKDAVLKAVESVDYELGKIAEECRLQGITLVITSDHGTVEEWLYPDGTINTGHTKNPVPFIIADFSMSQITGLKIKNKGELSDVSPTILELLRLKKPSEMTGQSLLLFNPDKKKRREKVLLIILDGWGISKKKKGNIIAQAKTPNFDASWAEFPHAYLEAAGEAVGMPAGTVGNSEAGHLHLGAGRRVLLDRVRIDRSIQDGSFFHNEALCWAMEKAREDDRSLHLLGIVSHYSSHGSIQHLFSLLHLAKQRDLKNVFIHALIGRRGERKESGADYINKIEEMCSALYIGRIVTVIGRYWALDREKNWDRVEKAYRALVFGEGRPVLLEK